MTAHPIDRARARFEDYIEEGVGYEPSRGEAVAVLDALAAAEAERDEWRQTALDERAAALDALEQIRVREARIKTVRDVLDGLERQSPDQIGWDAAGLLPALRRALDGDA